MGKPACKHKWHESVPIKPTLLLFPCEPHFLARHGSTLMQGYFYPHPLTAQAFEQFMLAFRG